MPTYEFRCPVGHDVERIFKISDAPAEVECPTCGAMAARRISGGAGLVFKGSGFYITDYGKDGKKDLRQAAKSSSSDKGSSASSGGDSSSGGASKDASSAPSSPAAPAAPAAPAPKKAAGE